LLSFFSVAANEQGERLSCGDCFFPPPAFRADDDENRDLVIQPERKAMIYV